MDGQCDACGDTGGSCFRTEPLLPDKKTFSVNVTRSQGTDDVMFALCYAPELSDMSCLYAPNNETAEWVPQDKALSEAYMECEASQEKCRNYMFERGRQYYRVSDEETNADTFAGLTGGCTAATCQFVERFCFANTTTFTCPVGSLMMFRKWHDCGCFLILIFCSLYCMIIHPFAKPDWQSLLMASRLPLRMPCLWLELLLA